MITKLKRKFTVLATVSMLILMSVLVGIMNVINYSIVVNDADSTVDLLFRMNDQTPPKDQPSGGDSSIDTENGYTYESGYILAVCPANGMGNEATNCKNFSSVAKKTTMNLTKGQTLTAKIGSDVALSVEMPCAISALVIFIGSSSATLFAA